jgi:hypothetical protein
MTMTLFRAKIFLRAKTFPTATAPSVLAATVLAATVLATVALAITVSAITLLVSCGLTTSARAEATAPMAWELKPDTGYAYDKEGKTFSYKMGTSNAGLLLKGAKKVPRGTLFFIGQNGQLYIRTGPYLEGDGKFMFGSN